MDEFEQALALLRQQLGHDVTVALATSVSDDVSVRIVNGYFRDGAVYVVTHEASHKMPQIRRNPQVALCRDLFCAKGLGHNLGNPKLAGNRALAQELRQVFCAFYDRHVNEDDPQTCILQINLVSAVAFSEDAKYVIDFESRTAVKTPFVNDIVY